MSLEPIQVLRDLIAIPSVNPMCAESGEAVEQFVTEYVEQTLRRAGIDCERQNVAPGRDNIIAVVQASHEHYENLGLMLNSHLDTVPVMNMTIDPFDPIIRDSRVYGRGASDAKGSIAAMMTALVAYANRPERPTTIVFAAMVDEEYSFSGSWKLIERDWRVSACVVGEPTRLASIIAHKGNSRWRAKVTGKSAHGGSPHLGHNAIFDAARISLALESYAQGLSRRPSHPLLGPPTLNVGRVAGGSSVNIVPDSCVLEIERRLLPGEDGRKAVSACEEWVRNSVGGNIKFVFDEPYLVDPPLETSSQASVVRAIGAAHLSEFGIASAIEGAHYGTDGSKLASIGIETVVCGPGDIAHAHTRDEFIEIEQVERAVRLYGRLISDWVPASSRPSREKAPALGST